MIQWRSLHRGIDMTAREAPQLAAGADRVPQQSSRTGVWIGKCVKGPGASSGEHRETVDMQSNEVRSCVALAVRREQAGAGARESLAVLCSLFLGASLPSPAAAAAAAAADTRLQEIPL